MLVRKLMEVWMITSSKKRQTKHQQMKICHMISHRISLTMITLQRLISMMPYMCLDTSLQVIRVFKFPFLASLGIRNFWKTYIQFPLKSSDHASAQIFITPPFTLAVPYLHASVPRWRLQNIHSMILPVLRIKRVVR